MLSLSFPTLGWTLGLNPISKARKQFLLVLLHHIRTITWAGFCICLLLSHPVMFLVLILSFLHKILPLASCWEVSGPNQYQPNKFPKSGEHWQVDATCRSSWNIFGVCNCLKVECRCVICVHVCGGRCGGMHCSNRDCCPPSRDNEATGGTGGGAGSSLPYTNRDASAGLAVSLGGSCPLHAPGAA